MDKMKNRLSSDFGPVAGKMNRRIKDEADYVIGLLRLWQMGMFQLQKQQLITLLCKLVY